MPLKNEPDWNERNLTFGQLFGPCEFIETEEEAAEYMGKLIGYNMRHFGQTFLDARKTVRSNLGYFAGYYDNETMHRIHTLFHVNHPILG